ncbi:MAG: DEAD/DEAH box helicase family protein [Anaerolineae bacterium]|jgi:type I restriction enzyme R subunit|nr:DEAD/DEAH box helicase family protein [Anaerolineae bacterium]
MSEADTCRKYITPALHSAGWENPPHDIREQEYFTDGRLLPVGDGEVAVRGERKFADYILYYQRDFKLAVVEAKEETLPAETGMQQAMDYAQILGLHFAYATNGKRIIEHDFTTGMEIEIPRYPTPDELFARWRAAENLDDDAIARKLLQPTYTVPNKAARYYQEIAINRAIKAILQGRRRVLLTMATGTGKTFVAFQIAWKLWSAGWNSRDGFGKPKILFLSDRSVLVNVPKDGMFAPFEDARWKIQGEAVKSREMYFALYQSIAKDENRPGLYKDYAADFFDLIIVDECHRGSARDDSNWREILEYFEPAYQLGMTATPLREDNRDTYAYFGDPIYTYSLAQGIEDGFLAPYRVHDTVTNVDALGWRPQHGQRDREGQPIPDKLYTTTAFDDELVLKERTEKIAEHLTDYLKATNRFAKTIVFCVDQEHAARMRQALINLNADLVQLHPDYVVRITSNEGDVGATHLDHFMDPEIPMPIIATTSRLLSTGVDAPTCKNIVLARVINSMTEFKQIIGRGTRVDTDHDKYFFTILDYTRSAMARFADPDFDGEPLPPPEEKDKPKRPARNVTREPQSKYYVDGVPVEIVASMVYELDPSGRRLNVTRYVDYAGDQVRTLYTDYDTLRAAWTTLPLRAEVIERLRNRGIDLDQLRQIAKQPDADPFDLLCHLAFKTPLHTRRERASRFRQRQAAFLAQYTQEARIILEELLDKYADHGLAQFKLPDALQVPPISDHGNLLEIAGLFGGSEPLKQALEQLQTLLYTV